MKTLFIFLQLILINSAFASNPDCFSIAREAAEINLSLKNKAYNPGGGITPSISKLLSENKSINRLDYVFKGAIYWQAYYIAVSLDNSCGLESIEITPVD